MVYLIFFGGRHPDELDGARGIIDRDFVLVPAARFSAEHRVEAANDNHATLPDEVA